MLTFNFLSSRSRNKLSDFYGNLNSVIFHYTMSVKKILDIFRNYQKSRQDAKRAYFKDFEEKMIYRTTKTENPDVTPGMVSDVLRKFKKA